MEVWKGATKSLRHPGREDLSTCSMGLKDAGTANCVLIELYPFVLIISQRTFSSALRNHWKPRYTPLNILRARL